MRNSRFKHMISVVLAFVVLTPLSADEKGITEVQAAKILTELRNIRELLEGQQRPIGPQQVQGRAIKVEMSLDKGVAIGAKEAPVTVVEFTDYQCPFCRQFYVKTFAELKRRFIDTGEVRFYSRDLPLDIHPYAMQAAQAGRCADEQKHFWEMRDRMSASDGRLDLDSLSRYAEELKMDVPAFRQCVASEKYKDAIHQDVAEALKNGANGTPSIVIGKTTAEGVDGELFVGALPYQLLEKKITAILPSAK
jgi:protein-disulfide isomerase